MTHLKKSLALAVFFGLTLVLFPNSSFGAANVSGTWTGTHCSSATGEVTNVTYVFTHVGNKLTGSYTNHRSGGTGAISGTVNGVTVNYRISGSGYWQTHSGNLRTDVISGRITGSSSGQTGTFSITRSLSGSWTGTHYSNATGEVTNVTYVFTHVGNNLTGSYTNHRSGGTGTISGTVNGKAVSYRISGSGYWQTHSGNLRTDVISGRITGSSSGQTGTFSITRSISGKWTGTHYSNTTGEITNVTYNFSHVGKTLSGSYTNLRSGGTGTISGTVNGMTVNYRISGSGYWQTHAGNLFRDIVCGRITGSSSGQTGTFSIRRQGVNKSAGNEKRKDHRRFDKR